MSSQDRPGIRKGRGAASNPPGRFESTRSEAHDDGWGSLDEPLPVLRTTVTPEAARRLISRNDSPDIPFTQSINPYRGCEHGCVYCYARPSHAYLNLSPGLDFETRLFYKADAAALLNKELADPRYRCAPIALGANTDPYQPIERTLRVTRQILEVLSACEHPVTIVTKGAALLGRDLELLAGMAERRLVAVYMSLTTLDSSLKRTLEPRAASPGARLAAIEALAAAGIPVGVLVAPVIPVLTDHEIERLLEAAARAGATCAGYTLLRLPYEVKDLFREWLEQHAPLAAAHVMSRVQAVRGGRDNDPRFGARMHGQGPFAALIAQRFAKACRRLGLARREACTLDTSRFVPPRADSPQLALL